MVSFTQLIAWQEAHVLAIMVYTATRQFPKEELFGITSQLRRSASSVSANISEGFGRSSLKDRSHFYAIARGSLTETQNHCMLAKDVGILAKDSCRELLGKAELVHKLLSGLIRKISEKI